MLIHLPWPLVQSVIINNRVHLFCNRAKCAYVIDRCRSSFMLNALQWLLSISATFLLHIKSFLCTRHALVKIPFPDAPQNNEANAQYKFDYQTVTLHK